jgi:hypothetical protein
VSLAKLGVLGVTLLLVSALFYVRPACVSFSIPTACTTMQFISQRRPIALPLLLGVALHLLRRTALHLTRQIRSGNHVLCGVVTATNPLFALNYVQELSEKR